MTRVALVVEKRKGVQLDRLEGTVQIAQIEYKFECAQGHAAYKSHKNGRL